MVTTEVWNANYIAINQHLQNTDWDMKLGDSDNVNIINEVINLELNSAMNTYIMYCFLASLIISIMSLRILRKFSQSLARFRNFAFLCTRYIDSEPNLPDVPPLAPCELSGIVINEQEVCDQFQILNISKLAGPDTQYIVFGFSNHINYLIAYSAKIFPVTC
jgi:hypothetical protein